ncbi:glycoside hydrolase family 2 TIM barrel-domain containing protein [uncultured Muriicola sp.]|uniref:glycoside hydrolase family 2 TIM barrel-domain containing protein n=1 Tax=uncultured Muriicola sp. TaxID=1583102 RepID=UPI0026396819|nr:glycoside hydrolase family 2 TIM barrel-domain containing protein [uncultured Muriicola sp.]
MKSKWNKNIYRSLLILSFLGINAMIIYGISSVWAYLNSGADKSSILHIQGNIEETYLPEVQWVDLENPGRPMEAQTLKEIQTDYLRSWYVRNIALSNNDSYGVADYYTDSMRIKIERVLDLNKQYNTSVKQTSLAHHPSLDFYSADGSLVVFTDRHVETYKEIWQNDQMLLKKKDTSSYKVLMLLEDGFWRIRHMVEIEEPNEEVQSSIKSNTSQSDIAKMKGLNYYPSKSAWDTFGSNFNKQVIANDFAQIRKMGLNSVRVFVPYEEFGKAKVSNEYMAKLKIMLDLANTEKLKVLVTLFDFYGNYDLMDWTLTHRHAEIIVKTLKDHPALLGWDLKNEPDLDFDSRGKELVLAWLEEMNKQVKKWDPIHPVTIGWSSPEAGILLGEKVDFISFHYYQDPSEFLGKYEALKDRVGDTPILLGEYGYSSYSGIWNAYLGSEKRQADYYREMQQHLNEEGIPYLFWTLYDFKEVPNPVVGRLPWRKQRQKYFGVISIDGREKPSYQYLDLSTQK